MFFLVNTIKRLQVKRKAILFEKMNKEKKVLKRLNKKLKVVQIIQRRLLKIETRKSFNKILKFSYDKEV